MSQSNGVFSAPGWNPSSDTDLQLWLSAQGTGLSNNAAVTSLTDLSSKGLTTTGHGTGGGPTFKTNIVNGFPGILFNGTDHYMSTASLVTTRELTVITVSAGVGASAGMLYEQSVNINSNNGFLIYGGTGYSLNNRRNGLLAQSDMISSGNWLGTTPKLTIFNYDPASGSTGTSQASFNGNTRFNAQTGTSSQFASNTTIFSVDRQTASGVPTAQTVTDTLYINARGGTSIFQNGYLFELAIFNSTKSQDWFNQAANFIWQKWGI